LNRHRRPSYVFLLFSLAFCVSAAAAQTPEAAVARKSVAQTSADRGKEAVLSGTYKGFVKVGEVSRRATLEIKDTIDEYGNNFTLQIEGAEPIEGRIVAREYSDSKAAFANLRFGTLAGQAAALSDTSPQAKPPSVSLRLMRRGELFKLESIEKDKEFLFETCIPSRCQEQVECQPCLP
jgi:hypothetical protein